MDISLLPATSTTASAVAAAAAAAVLTTASTTTMTVGSSNSIVINSTIPTIIIGSDIYGNSVEMPLVGAGTWQYNDTIAYESICKAFHAGYTFVDTAYGYKNQRGVGQAIHDCWNGTRDELFVMTKIPGGLTPAEVVAYHHENLFQLGLDYVDHLMTHFPSDWDEMYASKEYRQKEWLALEEIYNTGQARTIGISHYCKQHIYDILEVATILPSINQVEYHVGSQDIDHVIQLCNELGITFMSFSPLCGPCQYNKEDSLIDGTLVTEIASHYNNNNGNNKDNNVITGSQVALRYIVQQGIPVIPKSNTMSHLLSNRDIFSFHLSDDDMKTLQDATKPPAEAGDCDVP